MATHSSILAWRIPCTEEPGGSDLALMFMYVYIYIHTHIYSFLDSFPL